MARGGISRRALFRRLTVQSVGPRHPSGAPSGGAAEIPVVRSHLWKVDLLRRLSESHGGASTDRLLPAITVSDACRDHGACAAHCPTRALRLWQGDTAQGLSFDPRSCLSCGLCARACPEQALAIESSPGCPPPAERRLVSVRGFIRCRHCGSEAPDIDVDGHCPRCRQGVGMLRALMGRPANFRMQASEPRGVP